MSVLNNNMLALGSCIAGIGILATALLALLFRHPDAPRWTRPEIVAMLLCVVTTAVIGLGLGYTVYGLHQVAHGAGDRRGLLVLAAVAIVLALAWRGLRIRQRLRDYAATSNRAPAGSPATEPDLAMRGNPAARDPATELHETLG